MKTSSQLSDNYINSIFSFSHAIAAEKYLEDILKLIVTVTTNVTDIKICSIWLIDETENPRKIKLKASQAIDVDYVKNRLLAMNEGVVGYVATNQQTIIVKDVLKDPRFKEKAMAKRLGLVSMLGIPMKDKNDETVGVLNCFTTQPHEFSEKEISMMTTLANQAAVAIRNTELMVREQLIQEELTTLKKLEKAKDVLMHRLNIGMDEAYTRIHKCSTESLQSLRQVAETILISDQI